MALLKRISSLFWRYSTPSSSPTLKECENTQNIEEKGKTQHQKRKRHDSPEASEEEQSPAPKKIKIESVSPEPNEISFNHYSTPQSQDESSSSASLLNTVEMANETEFLDENVYTNTELGATPELDFEANELARLQRIADMENEGWAPSAIELFAKLDALGMEPLLPAEWNIDHPTIPEALFSEEDEATFINTVSKKGFRASKALGELITLGPKVRDLKFTQSKAYHTVTRKAIVDYLRWAYKDAGLSVATGCSRKSLDNASAAGRMLPLVIIEAAADEVPMEIVEDMLLRKLEVLERKWNDSIAQQVQQEDDAIRFEPPALFAIICTFTVVAIAAYETEATDDDGARLPPLLRNVSTFQFSQRGADVWNGLRLAIFGNHIRNEMLNLHELTLLGDNSAAAVMHDPDV